MSVRRVIFVPSGLQKLPAIQIFWTSFDDERVHRVDVDGSSNPADWLASGGNNPAGLAVDEETQKIYWSNITGTDLVEFGNYDGSSPTDVTVSPSNPHGLVVSSTLLYWADQNLDELESADKIDGSNPVQLDSSTGDLPSPVQLDRVNDKLFLYCNNTNDGLFSYDLDGGNKDNFFTPPNSGRGQGMDIDVDNEHVYYNDTINDEIRRVGYDGTGDTLILDTSSLGTSPRQLVLDLAAEHIYWADADDFIGRCDLDGGNASRFIELTPATAGNPTGIELRFPEGSFYATPNR